jgi:hypothetical protein
MERIDRDIVRVVGNTNEGSRHRQDETMERMTGKPGEVLNGSCLSGAIQVTEKYSSYHQLIPILFRLVVRCGFILSQTLLSEVRGGTNRELAR